MAESIMWKIKQEFLEVNFPLIYGAKSELEKLRAELVTLKAMLMDLQELKRYEQMSEMEGQIRTLIYDAEDVIDTFLTQAAISKSQNLVSRLEKAENLAKIVQYRREKKMQPILARSMEYLSLMLITPPDGPWLSSRECISFINGDNVVGLEDEQKTIMDFLKERKDELDVYSIIGMPGLGKSTLVRKIFHHKEVQNRFHKCIWIYVSQDFSIRDVLLQIRMCFSNEGSSGSDLEQAVCRRLQEEHFLLVMDDVWSQEDWDAIWGVLPKKSRNSKVLVTSRDSCVGCSQNRKPHQLRLMTEEESWTLLCYEIFGNLDSCPDSLEGIAKGIAKQCGGLPLTIAVIGGILLDLRIRYRDNIRLENAWRKVSENVNKCAVNDDKGQQISNVVGLSYKKLPHEFRDCFLYLAVFPEDYEIRVSTLVCLWIAKGFLPQERQELPEKTALDFLEHLIRMNLVMVKKRNLTGEVKTICVHRMIRWFCEFRIGIYGQKEIKMSDEGVSYSQVSEIPKCRWLSIHGKLVKFLAQNQIEGPKVSSLLTFYTQPSTLDDEYFSSIFDSFPQLRVLDLKSFNIIHFPGKVTKLILLRYLTLSCKELNLLPKSISKLWNLQTLLVDTESQRLEIKANIWTMIHLRHLKTKAEILLTGKGGADETHENLQTLTSVSPECCTKEVLKRAPNIKSLGIRGKLATLLDGNYSLDVLDQLQNLKMVNNMDYGSTSDSPLHSLPPFTFFPSRLNKLTLSCTNLEWNHISTLGQINSLRILKLKDNAFTGHTWIAVGLGFPSLEALLIERSNFSLWKSSSQDFPKLNHLVLKNCENLSEIPMELGKSLQKLSIEHVGTSAVEDAKKFKKDKEATQGEIQTEFSGLVLELGPGCE